MSYSYDKTHSVEVTCGPVFRYYYLLLSNTILVRSNIHQILVRSNVHVDGHCVPTPQNYINLPS